MKKCAEYIVTVKNINILILFIQQMKNKITGLAGHLGSGYDYSSTSIRSRDVDSTTCIIIIAPLNLRNYGDI